SPVPEPMMVPQEPLFRWSRSALELLSFVSSFLASGAIGFRYGALGTALKPGSGLITDERLLCERAAARAARFGLAGAVVSAGLFAARLPQTAARANLDLFEMLRTDTMVQTQVALFVVAVGGFAIAARRRDYGWALAAVGVVAGMLRALFSGQWDRLVNPIHMLAGGLWIGTLFMLVVVGLRDVLGSRLQTERRGSLAAKMVRGFSPLARAAVATLAVFGVITAWIHLGAIDRLWTTPYGTTLLVKLGVVLVVLGLGAWNWLRQRPRLGSETAARSLRASAVAELAFAGLVLLVTSVLVVMPDARPPGR
ncbi:MAG: CopD family protein, partial [Candidatus Eisenbacteria bacterium]